MTHTIGTGVRAVNDTRHLPNINGAAHVDEGDTNLQLLTFFSCLLDSEAHHAAGPGQEAN